MKKILKIEKGRGYFLDENNEYKVVTELSSLRLKEILEKVFYNEDIEFDLFEESTVHNAADRIIYSAVVTKMINLKSRRDEILHTIDSEFSVLKERYKID